MPDLDRILTDGQDPGAQQYLVLGTVPIKGKNLVFGYPGIFCTRYRAHKEKKRLQVKLQANNLYEEALEQCHDNNHVSGFI